MRTLTKFQAIDGTEHFSEEKCLKHEAMLYAAQSVNDILPAAIDDSTSFANGEGFIQHTPEAVQCFDSAMEAFLGSYFDQKWADMYRFQPKGFVGRYIDDSGVDAPYRLYTRRSCIDAFFREWGQPFYALNPERGLQSPWPNVGRVKMWRSKP